ncbi:MAG: hypothetical protein FGM47_02355 [Candidatus Nanopelagicaceae bacterium]|nr:hypothetical protein [Candidatus Nanopelagicaceae bacterium]
MSAHLVEITVEELILNEVIHTTPSRNLLESFYDAKFKEEYLNSISIHECLLEHTVAKNAALQVDYYRLSVVLCAHEDLG